jgi:hypothetical protein
VRVEHLNRCKTPIILSVNAGGTGVTLVPVPTNTAICHSDIRGRRPFEVSAKSIILFNCTLWDSVPDGSLQWSNSVLMCVCRMHITLGHHTPIAQMINVLQ